MDSLSLGIVSLAHILIGFYFVFFGFWNIYHWYPTLEIMAKKGLPHPYLILSIGIAWQIVAGSMIMFGLFGKFAALLLIPFTIISVFIFHPFWSYRGEHRALVFTIFMTNMTMTLGGLLFIIGPLSHFSELFI